METVTMAKQLHQVKQQHVELMRENAGLLSKLESQSGSAASSTSSSDNNSAPQCDLEHEMMSPKEESLQIMAKELNKTKAHAAMLDELVPPLEKMRHDLKAVTLDAQQAMLAAKVPTKTKPDKDIP